MANSDIDLLLVGKETSASQKLLKDLETRFGRTINVTAYAPAEFEAKRRDKSEFLFEVMRSPLIQLKPEPSSAFGGLPRGNPRFPLVPPSFKEGEGRSSSRTPGG